MRLISESKQWKLAAGVAFALLAVLWMGKGAFAQDAGSGAGTQYSPEESTPYEPTPYDSTGYDAGSGVTTEYDAGGGGTIDPESGFYMYPELDAGGGSPQPLDAGPQLGDGGVEITRSATRLQPRTVVE